MAQPLYYLPGLQPEDLRGSDPSAPTVNRAMLASRGLGETFADVRDVGACPVSKGPDGSAGVVIHYARPDGRLPQITQYKPELQTWTQASEQVWIGTANGMEPTEEDLRRVRQYPGYRIEIEGTSWIVPIVRRVDDTTELPRDMYWDAQGNIVEPIKAAYAQFWQDSAEVGEWFFAGNWDRYQKANGLRLAIQVIGLNYRYSRLEHNALRKIDVESHLAILGASVDAIGAQALEEAEKKST